MRHSKPVRLETALAVFPFGRHCFQLCRCGAVGNRTYQEAKAMYRDSESRDSESRDSEIAPTEELNDPTKF